MINFNMLTAVQGWEIEITKLVIDLQVDKAKTKVNLRVWSLVYKLPKPIEKWFGILRLNLRKQTKTNAQWTFIKDESTSKPDWSKADKAPVTILYRLLRIFKTDPLPLWYVATDCLRSFHR